MNTIVSSLLEFLPISAGLLSLVASVLSILIEKNIFYKQYKEKRSVHVQVNNRKIELSGYTEEEVIELIQRELSDKKQTQSDDSE